MQELTQWIGAIVLGTVICLILFAGIPLLISKGLEKTGASEDDSIAGGVFLTIALILALGILARLLA